MHAESARQFDERLDADIAFAAFNAADVVAMQAGLFGEFFLTHAFAVAKFADGISERDEVSILPHTISVAAPAHLLYTRSV